MGPKCLLVQGPNLCVIFTSQILFEHYFGMGCHIATGGYEPDCGMIYHRVLHSSLLCLYSKY